MKALVLQLQPIENESIADGTIGTGKFDETAVDRGLDLIPDQSATPMR